MRKGEKAELAYFSNKYICGPYHYRTSEQRFRQSHYDYEERRTCRSDRGYRIPPWRWRCFLQIPCFIMKLSWSILSKVIFQIAPVCICELSVRPDKCIEISISWHTKCIQFSQLWILNRNNRSGKLEASERKKLDGNVLFKAGKFWQASKKYEKASLNAMKLKKINHHSWINLVSFFSIWAAEFANCKFQAAKSIELNHSFTDEEMWLAKSSRLSCYLNDAACKLKLGEYLEASIS